jgi:CheY-like chemotaxis protein
MLDEPPPADRPALARAREPARILVVEDDFLIRMMLAEMLTDEGYEVVEAGSGDEALPLLDGSVALLLTDVQLPGALNGRALVEKARQTRPDLPVIYTSGRSDGMAKLGPHEVAVAKPYQSSDICAAVRKMLTR